MLTREYFEIGINRSGTDCYKWDYNDNVFGTDDLIPLWVADMDFRSPPEVIEALRKRSSHGVFGYTFQSANYYESIVNWLQIRHHWQIRREAIINTPGIVPGINILIQTFSRPGDKILYLSPVYDPFFRSIRNNNRVPISSDLIYLNNTYFIDFSDLEEKCKDTKILLFCSPHNPVGRVWQREELEKIAEICIKHRVLLVSDEIHSDLIFKNYTHLPVACISEEIRDHVITLNAPSKTFNVAGLSTSYAIIENEELRRKYQNAIDRLWLNSGNIFGLLALETAYRKGREWLDLLLEYLENNFIYLQEYLADNIPQIKPVITEGTYLAWLNCKGLKMQQQQLNEFLIKKARVGLTNGVQYGAGGEGFMRLNFGCPRKTLETALNRIQEAVSTLI